MSLALIESIFEFADLTEVLRPFQDISYLLTVFLSVFLANIGIENVKSIIEEGNNRYKLDNDPMCGLVTGGRPECWWSCDIQRVENPSKPGRVLQLIAEPSCLSDCYPGGHCLNALLADYHSAGGICRGSYLDVIAPGLFPVSRQPCELHEPDDYYHGHEIRKGLCSERTKLLLSDQQNCIHPLWKQKSSIVATANNLIRSMCDFRTWWFDFNKPVPIDRRVDTRIKTNETRKYDPLKRMRPSHDYENKLIPIDSIEEINGVNFARVPPLENTKHRYPWICSLRSRSRSVHYWEIEPRHFCGVTLLSRPPGPTVLVTSAHCVYICMSEEGRLVPNCCCPNVGPGLCTEDEACGTNAATVEITGADAEVICGEWDSATDTAEEYNVILPIESIAVHPSFDISRGEKNSQFVADDIAIIKVSDDKFEAQSRTHHIYPACLPTNNKPLTTGAVHSGWSKSPSLDYVTTHAPKYKEFYGEFSKQWHHSMKIRKCEDPQTFFWTGVPLKYPTNSYYPPGTICATEILGEFCPTSGESGSPLMVTDDHGRMAALGINSFIKGCSAFIFRKKSSTYESLTQKSENPAVYTKLSCYLPWVAAQYNMDYTPPEGGDPDPACLTGVGDINEVTAKVCRTNPSGWADDRDDIEAPCLFPFSLNGESHDTCIMDEIEGFTRPLFKCPIRRVKGYGTNYIDSHATGGHEIAGFFCPTNCVGSSLNDSGHVVYEWNESGPVFGPNGELELDPDNQQCRYERPVFATCKNNCPGVNFPVVAGGFALLAVSGVAGNVAGAGALGAIGGIAPVLGGLGLVGAAGAAGMTLMAMAECGGPMLCVAASGQCCFLTRNTRGTQCPPSC